MKDKDVINITRLNHDHIESFHWYKEKKGDKRSHCLTPLFIENSLIGEPFTRNDVLDDCKQP